MQRYCTELTERLLKSLDKEYNVVDMGAVVDVITALEKTTITKEVLEVTRLGKYINELRRKTNNDALAKRAKDLVRRWRDMVLPPSHPTPQPTPADTAPQALNGTKPQSPALRGLKPHSPAAIRALKPHSPALKVSSLKPQSPLLRDSTPLKVLSPASLHSERSRSPNPASAKLQASLSQIATTTATTTTATSTTNHRLNADATSKLGITSTHNHAFDAVPRTHSSNKRLRKEDSSGPNSPITPPLTSSSVGRAQISASSTNDNYVSRFEPVTKRPRLNGETPNYQSVPHATDTSNNNVSTLRGATSNLLIPSNQKVPSPRETEKTNDRLSEAISCQADSKREASDASATLQAQPGPKKRGRKKGSKSVKSQALPEDRVKEKLASISRNPKLKTTQELLADLQARGSSTSASLVAGGTTIAATGTAVAPTTKTASGFSSRDNETSSADEILRNDERALSARFHRAKHDKSAALGPSGKSRGPKSPASKRWENSKKSDDDEDEDEDTEHEEEQPYVDVARTKELTVEEILAKLPPLDRDAISWSDSDDEAKNNDENDVAGTKNDREISDADVDRLHDQCVEGLNGNFQAKINRPQDDRTPKTTAEDGGIVDEATRKYIYRRLERKEKDREFREWHQMLARPSYEGQILHILPYVIID